MANIRFNINKLPHTTDLVDIGRKVTVPWLKWFQGTINSLNNGVSVSLDEIDGNIVQTNSSISSVSNSLISVSNNLSNVSSNLIGVSSTLNSSLSSISNVSNSLSSTISNLNRISSNLSLVSSNLLNVSSNLSNVSSSLSVFTSVITITSNLTLNASHRDVIVDASTSPVIVTLPDLSSVIAGKEYRIHGYNATNSITINTTSSQQIRMVSTDTATSDNIIAGDVIYYINTGSYWKIT